MEVRGILKDTLVMVLAGGQGERLYPLTKYRAKPAVPFAGSYRLIDFTLSNCLNSGLRRIYVLTQYKSDSLNRHIRAAWNIFNPELGDYIEMLPPQQRMDLDWYLGTAHAIYQNIYTLEHERPENVVVLSGDHIYRMDYAPMLIEHVRSGADLTVACVERPLDDAAGELGVVTADDNRRVTALSEKPDQPAPADPGAGVCMCSMGVYVFKTEILVRRVIEDAKRGTGHDFGRDVVPAMIERGDRVKSFPFGGDYWRDVGTLDGYWQAHMDLVSPEPSFDLYRADWPIWGNCCCRPPARTNADEDGTPAEVHNSLLCNGAVVTGASVRDSVIGADVRVAPGVRIEQSVILEGTSIGRDATVRRAVIDKQNVIPENARLGLDPAWDGQHFFVSEGGVVVVAKETPFPA